MSVNNLRNYNWEQGTQASPVLLTGAEFNKLTALIEESNRVGSNINADIRGWVQVGQNITSYQKYLAELAKDGQGNPLLHVVNAQIDPVSYTVTPQSNSIKEGDNTKLNINGISLSALKFRITNHTVQSLDYQQRTTIDTQLGYVRVAPAQENTTWTDVVTIQACPVWEEWSDPNASIVEFDVTVNAISVSSVTITAPQYVKPTETFYPIVNFLPVNHTKPIVNTLEDAGAKRGICFIPTSDDFTVGKTTDPTKMSAIAPNTETPVGETWSLGCGVYAFTSSQTMATPSVNVTVKYPYIQFTVTTDGKFSDISTANPKITLQKVDSEDTPVGEPIILTGTVSSGSLVYTYGNGNVAGDGSETYKVNIENVQGYTTPNIANITPNEVITEVSASYSVIQPNVYIVYTDGTEQQYDDFVLNGMQFLDNKTPNYIHIVDSRKEFGVAILGALISSRFAVTSLNDLKNYGLDSIVWEYNMDISEKIAALFTHLDATKNNTIIGSIFSNVDNAVKTCNEYSIVYGEGTRNGYLPSIGEAAIICNNMLKIINIWKANGIETNITSGRIWSSTIDESEGRIILAKFSGNSVTDGDKLPPGSTSTNYVVPCFTL